MSTPRGAPRPQRMQLSRRAGFNLQDASIALNGLPARLITRPGRWGNPFTIDDTAKRYRLDRDAAQAKAVDLCRQWLRGSSTRRCRPAKLRRGT